MSTFLLYHVFLLHPESHLHVLNFGIHTLSKFDFLRFPQEMHPLCLGMVCSNFSACSQQSNALASRTTVPEDMAPRQDLLLVRVKHAQRWVSQVLDRFVEMSAHAESLGENQNPLGASDAASDSEPASDSDPASDSRAQSDGTALVDESAGSENSIEMQYSAKFKFGGRIFEDHDFRDTIRAEEVAEVLHVVLKWLYQLRILLHRPLLVS
jgi:hypothetical protein